MARNWISSRIGSALPLITRHHPPERRRHHLLNRVDDRRQRPRCPDFALRGSDSINRDHPGTLQPGRYDFLVSLAAISTLPGGVATGFEDFRLEFSDGPPTPTPEPASLPLLGRGAAILFARRRTAAKPDVATAATAATRQARTQMP